MRFSYSPKESKASAKFVRLKNGESVTGFFSGDIKEYFVLWNQGQSAIVHGNTPNAKFRFKVNLIVNENGVLTAKIFEGGSVVYRQLQAINNEIPLETIRVKITRLGEGKETQYQIFPMSHEKLSPQALEKLKAVSLLPLDSQPTEIDKPPGDDFFGPLPEAEFAPSNEQPDDLPF